jgi:hypothetical protein
MAMQSEWRKALGKRWKSVEAGPFFEMQEMPDQLRAVFPADYLEAVAEVGGREGFLGGTYLRLYRLEELMALNFEYQVPELFPEVLMFASDGCGAAFAFPIGQSSVVQVPLIPLAGESAEYRAMGFTEFVMRLAESGGGKPSKLNQATEGMEVHCKQPIALGGDPTDEGNRELVPVAEHPELCRYWNKVYRETRGG